MGAAAAGMVSGGTASGGLADVLHGTGVASSIISSISAGKTQKMQLEAQMRQMERAMQETKNRAMRNYDIMEESAKQHIGQQQVARATQGKIGGAGSDYLTMNDTIDKMARGMQDAVNEVGYDLHNQRYEIESTRRASKNAMNAAVAKSMGILDKGVGDYFANKEDVKKGKTPKSSSTDKYGSGRNIMSSLGQFFD